jgi:hypothetical protein
MYSQLDLQNIVATIAQLQRRIGERFPDSGLQKVAAELLRIGEETAPVLARAARPHWPLRIMVGFVVAIFVVGAGWGTWKIRSLDPGVSGRGDMLQTIESAAQVLIFFSVALFFFFSLETRFKRRLALRELHRLRSIVHIVDMHQLTKDPEHLLSPLDKTPSSPARQFNRFELSRYLDYCTELLSLSSKLAALHVQHLNDPVVLNAVNDVETLAANLSSKIWQKIVILDTVVESEPSRSSHP